MAAYDPLVACLGIGSRGNSNPLPVFLSHLTSSSDYDPHGPVGPTAFWKAADDDEISRFPSSLWVPHHTWLGGGDDSDMESWVEDDEVDGEEVADELYDLMAEAQMDVEDVVQTYVDHHLEP